MKTLLIVDDEPFMRRLLEQTLRKVDARVVSLASGDEALAWLADNHADLLLIDVTLPGRDGFATVAALRAAGGPQADLPVAMMTAGGLREIQARSAELGIGAALDKPFRAAELIETCTRLLEAGHAVLAH